MGTTKQESRVTTNRANVSGHSTRALVGKPRVLLLDEPTDHLDRRSLKEVLRNIRRLEEAPAVLLVSHDDRVAQVADEVIHLDAGEVIHLDAGEVIDRRAAVRTDRDPA